MGHVEPQPAVWLTGEFDHAPFAAVFEAQSGLSAGVLARRPVVFTGAMLREIDFSGLELAGFSARGTTFEGCRFENTAFFGGMFAVQVQSTYRRCTFSARGLGEVDPGQARFEDCDFNAATQLRGWHSQAGEFIRCQFSGTMRQCIFDGEPRGMWISTERLEPPRTKNRFEGNDFSAAELVDCDFRFGIDIGANIWPSGPDYVRVQRPMQRIAAARPVVEGWPEAARRDGLIMLDVLAGPGYQKQTEYFGRRDSMAVIPPGVRDAVWTLLT